MEKKSKRILIVTQSVDKKNQVLGFFHRWIEEFAKKFEFVTVICLEKGEYDLPKNVSVFSLGKESGKSRLKYIFNFYKYIWQERKKYDVVFIHMNQEYVIMGGILWIFLHKSIYLWRNHPVGNIFTRIAVFLSKKVFCTSSQSFTARFKKTSIMPVGIDTIFFKPNYVNESKSPSSILFLGRIAPVKNLDIIINALKILKERKKIFSFVCYGDSLQKDNNYFDLLRKKTLDFGLSDSVSFLKGIPNYETPSVYNKYNVFINVTDSGSFDKTILEAMSCGLYVITSNCELKKSIDKKFFVDTIEEVCVANVLDNVLSSNLSVENDLAREFVIKYHSIESLFLKFSELIY